MSSPIDYQAVLADLQARRAQLDAAINVIQNLLGGGGAGEEVPVSNGTSGGGTLAPAAAQARSETAGPIRNDTFFGLSTAAAVKKYLGIARRPANPRVIAQALREGGQIHAVDDKTAYVNVYSSLKRARDKDFVRTRNGEWGLAEWYSNKSSKADKEATE